ncbi:MAG: triose-phosphate isomerase [Elusimicrobiota bacterium]
MRKPFLAGNWKMNKNISEACELAGNLAKNLKDTDMKDILIAPPFTALAKVKETLKGSNIKLGAQNCSYAESGAYTGEISPAMIIDAGCTHVIIGHSERRQFFGDTDEIINKKIKNAIKNGLIVIFCVGETLEEREKAITFKVIEKQVREGLKDIELKNIEIAYEPVWAIGTGKTASPAQAEEVHAFIRNLIEKLYNKQLSETVRILYGGSVNPENIKELMACANVDGGLVGGASLKTDSFTQIVKLS